MNSQQELSASSSRWKHYEAAVNGFQEYWYPVFESKRLGRRPIPLKVLDQKIALVRAQGRAYAIEDRCPHRNVPFSGGGTPAVAKLDFPGHITCRYHGWVFDLSSGLLAAALTDGPDSPIVGKCQIRTYPVEERCGLVWIWMGKNPPVPVEEDIPSELLEADARIYLRFTDRRGNWRYAAENGFDEGHAKYLHRDSLWAQFRRIPAYSKTRIRGEEDDRRWISRVQEETYYASNYPGLGSWPRYHAWNVLYHPSSDKKVAATSIRLPGALRVKYGTWRLYEWYVPLDQDRHIFVQVNACWTRSMIRRCWWWLYYHLLVRGVQHKFLSAQDGWVIEMMSASHPERLYRPDISITTWRRFVEETARDIVGTEGGGRIAAKHQVPAE